MSWPTNSKAIDRFKITLRYHLNVPLAITCQSQQNEKHLQQQQHCYYTLNLRIMASCMLLHFQANIQPGLHAVAKRNDPTETVLPSKVIVTSPITPSIHNPVDLVYSKKSCPNIEPNDDRRILRAGSWLASNVHFYIRQTTLHVA